MKKHIKKSVGKTAEEPTVDAKMLAASEASGVGSEVQPSTENRTVDGYIQKVRGRRKNLDIRPREYLIHSEVENLMRAARSLTRNPIRNSAMILMGYRHGLCVSELCSLQWNQIDFENGRVDVVRVKNGYSSPHPLSGEELRLLRQIQRGKIASPYIFNSERGTPLSTDGFLKMLSRVAPKAGFEFSVHPHMLRHGCGFKLANDGVDTRTIQDYLGHKNIQHTVVYTKLSMHRFTGLWKGK